MPLTTVLHEIYHSYLSSHQGLASSPGKYKPVALYEGDGSAGGAFPSRLCATKPQTRERSSGWFSPAPSSLLRTWRVGFGATRGGAVVRCAYILYASEVYQHRVTDAPSSCLQYLHCCVHLHEKSCTAVQRVVRSRGWHIQPDMLNY